MPALFVVTLFVSAALLFMVQPMVGKMVLPLLGGSPAAWNTCMVFFQGLLLLGYLYAHALSTRQYPHRQPRVHLLVLVATAGWLLLAGFLWGSPVPIFRDLAPQGQSYPMFGVLALLAAAIGLPFLVVTTSAPLFQRWFNYTGHPTSTDPYFLYAASNAGSLLSLIAYPFVVEPTLTLNQQAWTWAGGFLVLVGLAYACGQMVKYPHREYVPEKETHAEAAPPPSLLQKLRWVGLAFVPSSLMLGVTFYMTTDIASLPLLWIIPLGLYLVTFIIAFAHTPSWLRPVLGNLGPVVVLLLVFVMTSGVMGGHSKHFLALAVHCGVIFVFSLLMHTELVRERPRNVRYLTQFFLLMSLGGVLGGVFNALVAPVLFPDSWEYPIAIAAGCLLVPVLDPPALDPTRRAYRAFWDVVLPAAFLGAAIWWYATAGGWADTYLQRAMSYCGVRLPFRLNGRWVGSWDMVSQLVRYALPCVVCFLFVDRPVRFGLCVAALLGVWQYKKDDHPHTLTATRSYYGILKVETGEEPLGEKHAQFRLELPVPADTNQDVEADGYQYYSGVRTLEDGEKKPVLVFLNRYLFHKLSHGTTLHGVQAAGTQRVPVRDDLPILGAPTAWDLLATLGVQYSYDPRQEPLTYYHRTGPVGHMVARFRATHDATAPMAMIGLGTGSVACYAQPGQPLTFYEIDPSVVKLVAGEGKHFTYLRDAERRGAKVEIVLGDARVRLEQQPDRRYGLLLVDAFSSDSIPVHLLTKQAVELYKSRLTEHGLLGLHISNRYIDLEPVCGKLAAECGMVCRVFSDDDESAPGKTRSSWVVLARTEADLGDALAPVRFWERVGAAGGGFPYYKADQFWPFDHPWRPVKGADQVPVWTDDYSDVLRVMKIDEVKWLRRQLGQPVPGDSRE